ncbi:alanine racemase [Pseudomonas sessilinigenes]|uniref:Alanine racemase n=1 Tax=Pseudomonas sessilinigenes TaxID=658629 RepID=A0ABX8MQR6_9PSED|nr:alanine racemase [Pseudomonas sessilinigenes]AZC21903.1 Diaminopimelate decarboxylase [Pseudomonas sessilinigenes]QXH41007.1 alanine racemase [Pseudomonas sessilinigenes]
MHLPSRTNASQPSNPLASLRHARVDDLLRQHPAALHDLVQGLGSPLHLMLPQVFVENIRQFQRTFDQAPATGTLLFAKKANKADCLIQACSQEGIGVDVASVGELEKALGGGVPGHAIGVSGPEKSERLLALSLSHQCLLAIDSPSELQRLLHLARHRDQQARLLLRCLPESQPESRFGLDPGQCAQAIALCREHPRWLRLMGFSFHLGGYSSEQRAQTANRLLDLCVSTRAAGLEHCRRLNLGGGLAVRYVSPGAWARFLQQDRPNHYHGARTFNGFYPYGAPRATADALADILATPVDTAMTLAQKAERHAIELMIEPGRALLDQAGISAFRVQGVKDRGDGYALVTVQGSSFSLSEQWFNSEFLPEPLLLPAEPRPAAPFLACVGGSTCLESDMLTWRKIRFDQPVRPGDLLVYLNTAGYQMDSNESPFHEARLPYKVVIELDGPTLRWKLDGLA